MDTTHTTPIDTPTLQTPHGRHGLKGTSATARPAHTVHPGSPSKFSSPSACTQTHRRNLTQTHTPTHPSPAKRKTGGPRRLPSCGHAHSPAPDRCVCLCGVGGWSQRHAGLDGGGEPQLAFKTCQDVSRPLMRPVQIRTGSTPPPPRSAWPCLVYSLALSFFFFFFLFCCIL